MANKVKFGLKNVYYSVITLTNNIPSYATPVAVPGAVSMSISGVGDPVQFYADDSEYYSQDVNNGYDGSLEVAILPDVFKTDVLGDTLDTNGILFENKDATPKRIALLYEFDGDANRTRHILYNVKVSRPTIESGTNTTTKEPKTDTMNIEARPAVDTGDVKAKIEYGTTPYATFFSAAYLKNAPTNTVGSATATFSKAAPADLTIDTTSTSGTNAVKNVMVDGANVGGVNLTASGVDVTIESSYIATLANGTHTIIVEFTQGASVTVTLTVTA